MGKRLAAFILAATALWAQRAGDAPPALIWDSLKGICPASLDWEDFHGKVVVLSFSVSPEALWDVPLWNRLAGGFHSQQVQFLNVVSGSEFLLDQALARTPAKTCILHDSGDATRQRFQLPGRGLPRTVIVKPDGGIAGYTGGLPGPEAIRAALGGLPDKNLFETPPLPRKLDATAGLDLKPSPQVRIVPVSRWIIGAGNEHQYITRAATLPAIIGVLWAMPPSRIRFPDGLDIETRYDLIADFPGPSTDDGVRERARQALENFFGIQLTKQKRIENVYRLRFGGPSTHVQPARKDEQWMSSVSENSIQATGLSTFDLARVFEGLLKIPVLDETGLSGCFDYFAVSHETGPAAAFELARQLGFELIPGQQPIEMLVVQSLR